MAPPTLKASRVGLLDMVHGVEPRLAQTTTGTGNAGGTTFEVNSLGNWPDNSFIDTHWAVLPNGYNGSSALETAVVSDFDQADGSGDTIITVHEAFDGQVASGVDAYLSPINPETLRKALNRAAGYVFPEIYVPRQFHHIQNSRAFNGCWDFWDTLPVWWKESNSALTTTQLTSTPYAGVFGVSLVADGTARYLYSDPIDPSLMNELAGESVTFHCMMLTSGAGDGGVSIRDGGGVQATANSVGGGAWEEVVTAARTIVAAVPTNPIEFRINVAASASITLGPCWTEGGKGQTKIPVSGMFKRGPSRLEASGRPWPDTMQDKTGARQAWHIEDHYPAIDSQNVDDIANVVVFDNPLSTTPKWMTFHGEDYMSEATLETDVFEVNFPRTNLFYMRAVVELKKDLGELVGSGVAEAQRRLGEDWEAAYDKEASRVGMTMPRVPSALRPMFSGPAGGTSPSPQVQYI